MHRSAPHIFAIFFIVLFLINIMQSYKTNCNKTNTSSIIFHFYYRMYCHEVSGARLTSEAAAPFLLHLQDSYPSFRSIVVRRHPWVFEEVEHIVSYPGLALLHSGATICIFRREALSV